MRRAIVLVILVSSLPAAELVVRDLRVGVDLLPLDFDYTLKDSTGSRSGTDVFARNVGISIGGRYSLARIGDSHGTIVGMDLSVARAEYAPADGVISTYALAGELGYGWAMSDAVTVMGTGRIGLGVAHGTFNGAGSFASYAPSGPLGEYGLRAGVLWTVTDTIILDGTLGWRHAVTRMTSDGRDLDLDNGGLLVSVGMAWRFTSSPWRLE